MITGMVSGDFGKLHSGHLNHIMKAYELVDYLWIVTHTDESIRERKGYEPDPLPLRIRLLEVFLMGLGGKGDIVMAVDSNGSSLNTLRKYKPDIFAKGGDRTPGNMPEDELRLCAELGIKIEYNIGGLLNSSRSIANGN